MDELINIINISKINVGLSVYVPSLKEKKSDISEGQKSLNIIIYIIIYGIDFYYTAINSIFLNYNDPSS